MRADRVSEKHQRGPARLPELDRKLVFTLDTHPHADHVTVMWRTKKAVGTRIVLSRRYGAEEVDVLMDPMDCARFGQDALELRATPGQGAGRASSVGPDRVFTGDALVIRGAGRVTSGWAGGRNGIPRSGSRS